MRAYDVSDISFLLLDKARENSNFLDFGDRLDLVAGSGLPTTSRSQRPSTGDSPGRTTHRGGDSFPI